MFTTGVEILGIIINMFNVKYHARCYFIKNHLYYVYIQSINKLTFMLLFKKNVFI